MTMREKMYILFDLDGTISDPKVGMTKSIQYSLRTFGIEVANMDTLTPFIGPPLRESYKEFYGFNEEEVEKAVAKYREYFTGRGIFENTLYPDMDILLETLYKRGKTLLVATSKPMMYAKKILEYFAIDTYFSFIAGSELNGERSIKSEVIQYALANMGIAEIEKAVMIGDRKHDIIGAKEVGMDNIGVLYGYGDLPELQGAGATVVVESVEELRALLVG